MGSSPLAQRRLRNAVSSIESSSIYLIRVLDECSVVNMRRVLDPDGSDASVRVLVTFCVLQLAILITVTAV